MYAVVMGFASFDPSGSLYPTSPTEVSDCQNGSHTLRPWAFFMFQNGIWKELYLSFLVARRFASASVLLGAWPTQPSLRSWAAASCMAPTWPLSRLPVPPRPLA